jgi:hypothetical protein
MAFSTLPKLWATLVLAAKIDITGYGKIIIVARRHHGSTPLTMT